MPVEPLALMIGGDRHEGFVSGSVRQTFGATLAATTFQVAYAARADERSDPVVIEAGDAVTLCVGDEDLVRGFVVDDGDGYDARSRNLTVSGASRVQDLIDCSAVVRSRVLHGQTLFEIARALTDGYEIRIDDRVQADEPIERFAIQEGESIADALMRAARLRGVVLADLGGDLVITRVGQERTATAIERGVNLLRGQRTRSWRERFSEYRFRGQTRTTDDAYGTDALHIGQRVSDLGVTRLRRLVVQAQTDRREDIGRRAILERNARAGRSERLTYEVAGWTCAEGLWRPNTRVRVVDDQFEVDAELLIVGVTHVFDDRRYRTTLELTRPEAFSELAYPIRPRGGRWR